MAAGRKTGGRKKGTPNKAKAELDFVLAQSAQMATATLTPEQIATMTPLDVMVHAMRLEVTGAQWRNAAVIAEKCAPYFHAKLAPRGETDDASPPIIKVTGGLPE